MANQKQIKEAVNLWMSNIIKTALDTPSFFESELDEKQQTFAYDHAYKLIDKLMGDNDTYMGSIQDALDHITNKSNSSK